MKYLISVTYLFLIIKYTESGTGNATANNTTNQTFKATNEWQDIKEGQKIPAGLHIRLNLQSSRKQAKLLNPDETKSSEGTRISELTNYNKDVMKNHAKPLSIEYSTEEIEKIRKTYKDYKQLKKEFDKMKSYFKTDFELITGLMNEYNKTNLNKISSSAAIQLEIFENLNYLVHQIDNALWFIDLGGLDYIVLPMIVNQTNREFRILSLRILGALTQNNSKAQIKVYEKNFGSYLSNILLQSNDINELSAALYAFGSLLRKFPVCQREILSNSGTKALISVITKDTDIKIKIKVLILVSDLLTDKEQVINAIDVDVEKSIQYQKVFFEEWLNQYDYCKIVEDFLSSIKKAIKLQLNIVDEIIESLSEQKFCHKKWSESSIIRIFFKYIRDNLYSNDEEYLNEILVKFENFYHKIFKIQNNKDEL